MKRGWMVIGIIAFMVSCSPCKQCTKQNSPSSTVCRSNYNSDEDYNTQISAWEAAGYSCQ